MFQDNLFISQDNLFNFIMTLYIGFFIIYLSAPKPKILYKKIISPQISTSCKN
jgi:hypothetical protein